MPLSDDTSMFTKEQYSFVFPRTCWAGKYSSRNCLTIFFFLFWVKCSFAINFRQLYMTINMIFFRIWHIFPWQSHHVRRVYILNAYTVCYRSGAMTLTMTTPKYFQRLNNWRYPKVNRGGWDAPQRISDVCVCRQWWTKYWSALSPRMSWTETNSYSKSYVVVLMNKEKCYFSQLCSICFTHGRLRLVARDVHHIGKFQFT